MRQRGGNRWRLRYTCGRPVGLKTNVGLFARKLEVGLALTSGSHQSDLFPFSNETDFNAGKTVTGRLQYKFPIWNKGLELSASGSNAARATVGLRVDLTSFLTVKAEYVVNRGISILEFPDDVFTTSLVASY